MTTVKRRVAAAAICVAAVGAGGVAQAQQSAAGASDVPAPAAREFGGIRYMTGGISEEERSGLLAQASDFNLKLTFAQKAGNYLSDVKVVVTGESGRKVLELESDGPLVFAKLPPGEYRISATAAGREQTQSANVGESGQQALNFYW